MKVHVFWATDPLTTTPDIIQHTDWNTQPKKAAPPNPQGIVVPDGTKGWLHSITIFGRCFKGDHIALISNPSGHPAGTVKVVLWDDDLTERTVDEIHAKEVIIEPPVLSNGKWSAIQRMTLYMTNTRKTNLTNAGVLPQYNQNVLCPIKLYTEFVKPAEADTIHGIWENDADNTAMEAVEMIPYHDGV